MHITRYFNALGDPVWQKISSFSYILFFVFLSDGILSFWIPNFLQSTLKSPFLMGLVMSFSSVVGFGADAIFPQLLKNYSVRKLLISAIMASGLFVASLFAATFAPHMLVLLFAMSVWGVYYEYLHFSSSQFVADSIPLKLRSSGWAIIGIFKNLAYFFGPIIAGIIVVNGDRMVLTVSGFFVLTSFFVYLISHGKHSRPISFTPRDVSVFKELSHWRTLTFRVWPVLVLSLLLGLIDSAFWTTGAVWSESLSKISFWGTMILPAYQLPLFFMGIFIAKLGIFKGKKKLAELFLLVSGFFLFSLAIPMNVFLITVIIFASGVFLSMTYPLVEATYSDIIARMGIERKHLVGLSASTISISYIVGPTLSGFIANYLGEQYTFSAIGVITILTSLVLLILTPKKIHLPQEQIAKWGNS